MYTVYMAISHKVTDVFSCFSMRTDVVLATVPASAALQLMLWMFTV